MLDFGKIIIYTSNLRIIRAPPKKPETVRHHAVHPADLAEGGHPRARDKGSRRRAKALCAPDGEEKEQRQISDTDTKVMILGQIILGGVVGVLSPPFLFLLLFLTFSPTLQPFLLFFLLYLSITTKAASPDVSSQSLLCDSL